MTVPLTVQSASAGSPQSSFGANSLMLTWGAIGYDAGTPIVADAYAAGNFSGRFFAVTGTFGAGGSITLKGSNDGTNYFTLKDRAGNAATLTSAGGVVLDDTPLYVKPEVTAGDGTTALVPTLLMRRAAANA